MPADLPEPYKRRLPALWCLAEIPGGYTVKSADGRQVAWIYGRDDVRSAIPGMLMLDEARRIATAIVRLPELLKQASVGGKSGKAP
jgi:hypothetical protein